MVRVLSGHTDAVHGCAFSPDGRLALSASDDHTLRLWEVANGHEVTRWTIDAALLCCSISPDGVTVIAGDSVRGFHFLTMITK
jgi:WD40 repeat protein